MKETIKKARRHGKMMSSIEEINILNHLSFQRTFYNSCCFFVDVYETSPYVPIPRAIALTASDTILKILQLTRQSN